MVNVKWRRYWIYIPRLTGNVELRVVAFRGTIASEPVVLTVQVVNHYRPSSSHREQ
jgi:hypothetical protein